MQVNTHARTHKESSRQTFIFIESWRFPVARHKAAISKHVKRRDKVNAREKWSNVLTRHETATHFLFPAAKCFSSFGFHSLVPILRRRGSLCCYRRGHCQVKSTARFSAHCDVMWCDVLQEFNFRTNSEPEHFYHFQWEDLVKWTATFSRASQKNNLIWRNCSAQQLSARSSTY